MAGRGQRLLELFRNLNSQESPKPGAVSQPQDVSGTGLHTADNQIKITSPPRAVGATVPSPTGEDERFPEMAPSKGLTLEEAVADVSARQQKSDDYACLDDWNPMEEDFKSREFNCYDSGPGKDLPLQTQRPIEGEKQATDFQLYVTGIPLAMSEDGLQNLFSRAGNVSKVKKLPSKFPSRPDTYGFVHFRLLSEVESAVRMLDSYEIGDCMLRVRIALSQEEREARRKKTQLHYSLGDEGQDEEAIVIADDDKNENDSPEGASPAAKSEPEASGAISQPVDGSIGRSLATIAETPYGPSSDGADEEFNRNEVRRTCGAVSVSPGASSKPFKKTAKPPVPRPCLLCGVMAHKQCSRCSGPYCSAKCQQEDWLYHKVTCQKPMNDFEKHFAVDDDEVEDYITEVVNSERIEVSSLQRETLAVGTLTKVAPMDSHSPSDISLVKNENLARLEDLTGTMNMKFTNQPADDNYTPQVGDICAAPYQEQWYRAEVENLQFLRMEAGVTFIDYGNKETVAIKDLAKLHPTMVGMPAQAIPCSLGLEPVSENGEWCQESLHLLANFLCEDSALMATAMSVSGQKTIVELTKDGVRIADVLVSVGYAKTVPRPGDISVSPPKKAASLSGSPTQPAGRHSGAGDGVVSSSSSPLSSRPAQPENTPSVSAHETITPTEPTLTSTKSAVSDYTGSTPNTTSTKSAIPNPTQSTPNTTSTKSAIPDPRGSTPNTLHGERVAAIRAACVGAGDGKPGESQVDYVRKRPLSAGDQLLVKVIHVESLDKFWVQTLDSAEDFLAMQSHLQEVYAAKKPKSGFRCPKSNLVAAFSPVTETWSRGRVLSYDTHTVLIHFIDDGKDVHVDFCHIQNLEGSFFTLPPQALSCKLESFIIRTGVALDCFKSYVKDVELELKILTIEDGMFVVDLQDPKKAASTRDTILTTRSPPRSSTIGKTSQVNGSPPPVGKSPSPKGVSPPDGIVMVSSLAKSELPRTSDVHSVTVTNATSFDNIIICDINISEQYDDFLDEVCDMLQEYTDSYKPKTVGELVFVKADTHGWARGEVLMIGPADKVRVRMIDDEHRVRVWYSELAPVSCRMKQPPSLAIRCALWNVASLAPGISWKEDIMPEIDCSKVMRAVVKDSGTPNQIELFTDKSDSLSLNTLLIREGKVLAGIKRSPTAQSGRLQPSLDKDSSMPSVNTNPESVPAHPANRLQTDNPTGDSEMKLWDDIRGHQSCHSERPLPVFERDSSLLNVENSSERIPVKSPLRGGVDSPGNKRREILAEMKRQHEFQTQKSHQTPEKDTSMPNATTNPRSPPATQSGQNAPRLIVNHRANQKQLFSTQKPNVDIIHVENPGSFFCHWNDKEVRQCFEEADDNFRRDMLASKRPVGAPVGESLAVGGIVAVFSPDSKWYRAEITHLNFHGTGDVLVRLVDYGSRELVKVVCVRPLPEFHRRLPFQAIHCGFPMWDQNKSLDTETATQLTKAMLENSTFDLSLNGYEDGKYRVVDIRVPSSMVSLIREDGPLRDILLMRPVCGDTTRKILAAQTQPVVDTRKTSKSTMPLKCVAAVSYVTNINDFYIFIPDDAPLFLSERVNSFCLATPQTSFSPRVDELCCAQFSVDSMWYRARVLDVLPDRRFNMLFIDYGNTEVVDEARMRPISPHLGAIPPRAFKCTLHGVMEPKCGWRLCDGQVFQEFVNEGHLDVINHGQVGDCHPVTLVHPIRGSLAEAVTKMGVGIRTEREITLELEMMRNKRENELLKQKIAELHASRTSP